MGLAGSRAVAVIREGVAERLARVANGLPDGMTLIVWDAWRSFETQQALYETWMADLARKHSEWSQEVLHRETARYVSVPSRDPNFPAPHITGGAVDLTLADANGRPLDLGTHFDAFVPQAGATALEQTPCAARDNRRLLFWSMAAEGFTAYVEEWWHFDYGDQFWGSITGQAARYGPIEPRG
jgi:D-alanyl-D-alanine dipeptidase